MTQLLIIRVLRLILTNVLSYFLFTVLIRVTVKYILNLLFGNGLSNFFRHFKIILIWEANHIGLSSSTFWVDQVFIFFTILRIKAFSISLLWMLFVFLQLVNIFGLLIFVGLSAILVFTLWLAIINVLMLFVRAKFVHYFDSIYKWVI